MGSAVRSITHRCLLGFASANTLPSNRLKHSPLSGWLEMGFIVLSKVQFQNRNLVHVIQNKSVVQ